MSFLNLKRPIVFFDTETTGLDIKKDRIVELSTIKLFEDGRKEIFTQRFNPEIQIPFQATKVHGISNDDVLGEPTFPQKANEIAEIFHDADICGYNVIGYDYPLLLEEFVRANIQNPFVSDLKIIDPMVIFKKNERRNLENALKFYCNEKIENAHSAEVDTLAALKVFEAQCSKYNLSHSVEELHNYCEEYTGTKIDRLGKFVRKNNEIVFSFGVNKNKKATDYTSYLQWMLNGNFDEDTKAVAQKILNGELK